MKRRKIVYLYIIALICVFGICISVFFIMRGQYNKKLQELVKYEVTTEADSEYVVSELAALLGRSYFFSDKMMLDAYTKLNECYLDKKSYLSTISACLYSIYFSEIYEDVHALGENINRLADCCLVFNAENDAELLFNKVLVLAENSPKLIGEISARAHWGLAKVYAETDTKSQALDHAMRSVKDAPENRKALYKSMSELIMAEIQYKQGKYSDCELVLSRAEKEHPAEAEKLVLEYALPLLALKGLLAAQKENFELSFEYSDQLIELGRDNELFCQVGDYLDCIRRICIEKGSEFPEAYDKVLVECYKTNAERGTAFITQYSILEYTEYTAENKLHFEAISHIAWIALLLVLIVLNTIVKLYMSSYTDALTGLYNKRAFNRRLHALHHRRKFFGAVIFDVDNFKMVNDTYGHETGDEVLVRLAKQLEKSCRLGCTAYRVGGEEFCILIKYIKKSPPYQIAETVRAAVEAFTWHNGMNITVSAGVAIGKSNDLYKNADERLYVSKRNGRNQVN